MTAGDFWIAFIRFISFFQSLYQDRWIHKHISSNASDAESFDQKQFKSTVPKCSKACQQGVRRSRRTLKYSIFSSNGFCYHFQSCWDSNEFFTTIIILVSVSMPASYSSSRHSSGAVKGGHWQMREGDKNTEALAETGGCQTCGQPSGRLFPQVNCHLPLHIVLSWMAWCRQDIHLPARWSTPTSQTLTGSTLSGPQLFDHRWVASSQSFSPHLPPLQCFPLLSPAVFRLTVYAVVHAWSCNEGLPLH